MIAQFSKSEQKTPRVREFFSEFGLSDEAVLANLIEELPATDTQKTRGLRAIPSRMAQRFLNDAPFSLRKNILEMECGC